MSSFRSVDLSFKFCHCTALLDKKLFLQFGNTVYSHEGIKLNPASTSDSVCIGEETLHIPWLFEYATENRISFGCMSPITNSVPFLIFQHCDSTMCLRKQNGFGHSPELTFPLQKTSFLNSTDIYFSHFYLITCL